MKNHDEAAGSVKGERLGISTGTCATAATKAALICLSGTEPDEVELLLPNGEQVRVSVEACGALSPHSAFATVIKDAGDDPDVTDGAAISARITVDNKRDGDVLFRAGEGVGTVTRPGLQVDPGEPAINPVPRQMLTAVVRQFFPHSQVEVTIAVQGGAELAKKTFNPKLGIEGGISILGTSGRVVPRSEEAWLRSLIPQIDVALAAGKTRLFFVTGSFGAALRDRFPDIDDVAVIHIGNFIGDMLQAASQRGVKEVILAGHIGKLVKVAAGIFNTHSRFGDARLETVAALAARAGASPFLVRNLLEATTAEAAVTLLVSERLARVWNDVAERVAERSTAFAGLTVHCVLTDYRGDLLGSSKFSRVGDQKPSCSALDISVVGVGPGNAEYLTPAAWREIHEANVLVGGARHLEQFARRGQDTIPITSDMAALARSVRSLSGKKVVFLASGDPLCFGVAEFVLREFSSVKPRIVPGISSVQLAMARLGLSWDQVSFASVHGRAMDGFLKALAVSERLLVLTDARQPAELLARVAEREFSHDNLSVVVLEKLGFSNEKITEGTSSAIGDGSFDPLSVVYFERRR